MGKYLLITNSIRGENFGAAKLLLSVRLSVCLFIGLHVCPPAPVTVIYFGAQLREMESIYWMGIDSIETAGSPEIGLFHEFL